MFSIDGKTKREQNGETRREEGDEGEEKNNSRGDKNATPIRTKENVSFCRVFPCGRIRHLFSDMLCPNRYEARLHSPKATSQLVKNYITYFPNESLNKQI